MLEDTYLHGNFDGEGSLTSLVSVPFHGRLEIATNGLGFVYLPTPDFNGRDAFTYGVDGRLIDVQLEVLPVEDVPVLSPDITRIATQGAVFTETLQAHDPDGDSLRFFSLGLPEWLALDPVTGELNGLPQQSDIGLTDSFTLGVADETGLIDELTDVRLEVLRVDESLTVNTAQFPDSLTARSTIDVQVISDEGVSDGLQVRIEPNFLIQAEVQDGLVRLTASDVAEVVDVSLEVVVIDEIGQETRDIIPITLRPLTPSGLGQTLLGSGQGHGVHIVVLGDGYTLDQRASFENDVETLLATLADDPYVSDHLALINLHALWVESVDSGIDDNVLNDARDTAFDGRFNCDNIPRLICADRLAVFEAAFAEYADVDQIVLLINDLRYGGSAHAGGGIAIASRVSPGLAIHELWHSLAGLGDEYVDTSLQELVSAGQEFDAASFANIAITPSNPPWAHWLSSGDVAGIDREPVAVYEPGVFEGALYTAAGRYRPTVISRMRDVNAFFGPVNGEAWVLALYRKASAVREFQPLSRALETRSGDVMVLSVKPWFDHETLRVEWQLNGNPLSAAITGGEPQADAIELSLPAGDYRLSVSVVDISGAIRRPSPHDGEFQWMWSLSVR